MSCWFVKGKRYGIAMQNSGLVWARRTVWVSGIISTTIGSVT